MSGSSQAKANSEAYASARIAVPPAFEQVFSHFYVACNDTTEPVQKTLLPSFQTIMVFSFGSGVPFSTSKGNMLEAKKVMVLGPVKQPIHYTLLPGVDILIVNFKSDGFYNFFGQAVVSAQYPVHPDELLNENCFDKLWSVLEDLDTSERIAVILDFAKPYIRNRDPALSGLEDHGKNVNVIKVIADQIGQTERSIQLKHKKYLGYSAKEITRYQRFLKLIEFVEIKVSESDQSIDWQACVDQFGYYDQSQLIHDFQHYLALSPKQYIKFQQDICVARPF